MLSSRAAVSLAELRDDAGMGEQHGAQLIGLCPDRIESRVREVYAGDVAADRGALQPLLAHRRVQLLHRQVGRLQREGGEAGEAFRILRAEGGHAVVVDRKDAGRDLPWLVVPERVDQQHLHVDFLLIHRTQALLKVDVLLAGAARGVERGLRGSAEFGSGFAEQEMGVDVDRPHAPAIHRHGLPARLAICARLSRPQSQKAMPAPAESKLLRETMDDPPCLLWLCGGRVAQFHAAGKAGP